MHVAHREDDSASVHVNALRRRLSDIGDPAIAPEMQRYMKSAMPFHGIKMSATRSATRVVARDNVLSDEATWRRAVLALWDEAAFREERYAAIELADHRLYRQFQTVGQLPLYEHMITSGAWWDVVDPIATRLVGPILRNYTSQVAAIITNWAVSPDMWLRRSAIICQLQSKTATDVELLESAVVENLQGSRFGDEFFIRKAIGWALRQRARMDPEWVMRFVERHDRDLSTLSRREALKHLAPN